MMSTPPPLLPSHSTDRTNGTASPPRSAQHYSPNLTQGTPRRSMALSQPEKDHAPNGLAYDKEKGDMSFHSARKSIEISPNLPDDSKQSRKMSAAMIIPIWIALSSAVILYNKYLYSTLHFPYPVFITSYHLGCAAIGTRILRATTNLMDGLDTIHMTREIYLKSILPIGVLFSGSLILSNTAYLSLSVSFIQMLKAFTPVAILLISAIFKIQQLNQKLILIVILISTGCALAAYGELHFQMFGFLCQTAAVMFESSRLVMIQILLQGFKMDPLCSLHYYAPVIIPIHLNSFDHADRLGLLHH
ncbi:hypothetical protein BCR39DRAFT_523542 [Naematelia encephala]|uniref:Sugar phosphate transporter domain-containing protein n=1 Tax=Naematelia encephala TaxID=71784 RepID=A0A1Y2BBN7_9TREE|nr:hypothetical protein BCR39DRAFT_523542 [Naematelia encephala]